MDAVGIIIILVLFAIAVAAITVILIEWSRAGERKRLKEPPYVLVTQPDGTTKKAIPKVLENGQWRNMTWDEVEVMLREGKEWSPSAVSSED